MERKYEMNPEMFFYIVRKCLAWIIVIGIFTGVVAGLLSVLLITPKYSSSTKLYVNNTQDKTAYMTQSDLAVAKSLVDTYIVIIESDTTLEKVAAEAQVDYTPKKIRKNLKAASISGTEAFSVTVTDPDADVAYRLAAAIVSVAPDEISRVVEGGNVKVIDQPKLAVEANDRGTVRNAIIGFFAGFIVSFVAFFLAEVLDITIYEEEDLEGRFSYPLIGVIPMIVGTGHSEKTKRTAKKGRK